VEHGPRGGDELNLIEPGKNYGWPLVSYAVNYNGVPIPSPATRTDLAEPVLYWTPVIAPGNLMFYKGNKMFPQWNGSGFVGGMATMALVRITFDGKGGAQAVDRWSMGFRVRDVEEAPDGALWMVEDANPGGVYRLTPKGMAVSAPIAQAAAPAASTSANASNPASLVANNNCLLCHRVGSAGGDIAPSLNGVGTRRTPEQIRAAIVSPPAKTAAGNPNPMPSYANKLSAADLNSLVQYLSSLPAMP
jgi:mono/diheme cytochrome c family protein